MLSTEQLKPKWEWYKKGGTHKTEFVKFGLNFDGWWWWLLLFSLCIMEMFHVHLILLRMGLMPKIVKKYVPYSSVLKWDEMAYLWEWDRKVVLIVKMFSLDLVLSWAWTKTLFDKMKESVIFHVTKWWWWIRWRWRLKKHS